jgi:putative transposase
MILTYKVKHGIDLSSELAKVKQVAEFAIANRDKLSTKWVKHFGVKSAISNQILRKYGKNKKVKSVNSVLLTIPAQAIKRDGSQIRIVPLKINLEINKQFEKVNQIELDNEYAYIAVTVQEKEFFPPINHIGVDLNATGHCAVVAVKETGKVYKLGKSAQHYHNKYKAIRKILQKRGLYKKVKQINNRESRIVRDINHKISRYIVNLAVANQASINLEDLRGIRKNKKHAKSFNHTLNSWSFYQLKQFIKYKAALEGVTLSLIDPAFTSKCCSICGAIGDRQGKHFKCPECGHVEHADSNAAFNIAYPSLSIVQLQAERDVCKGSTDTPQRATSISQATLRTSRL